MPGIPSISASSWPKLQMSPSMVEIFLNKVNVLLQTALKHPVCSAKLRGHWGDIRLQDIWEVRKTWAEIPTLCSFLFPTHALYLGYGGHKGKPSPKLLHQHPKISWAALPKTLNSNGYWGQWTIWQCRESSPNRELIIRLKYQETLYGL